MTFHIQKVKAIPLILYAFERATGVLSKQGSLVVQTERLSQDDFTNITELYKTAHRTRHVDDVASAMMHEDDTVIEKDTGTLIPSELFRRFDDTLTDDNASLIEKCTAAEAIVLAVGHLLGYEVDPPSAIPPQLQ